MLVGQPLKAENVDVCSQFEIDGSFVNFTLEMRLEETEVRMRVPTIFFEDRWKRVEGNRTTARSFVVDVDTFEPRTRAQNGQLNKQGKLNSLGFVIGDTVPDEDLADVLTLSAQLWQNRRPFSSITKSQFDFGLQEAVLPFKKGQRLFVSSVQNSAAKSFLICTGDLQVAKVKGCRHYFRSTAKADVSATYAMSEISRWKEIQHMIDSFLICATE